MSEKVPSEAPRRPTVAGDLKPLSVADRPGLHGKQYFKLGRALRTETTFNDTYDFGIGKKLENLPRLLDLELQSQRPTAAASQFAHLVMPSGEAGQRAPGLRFGDPPAGSPVRRPGSIRRSRRRLPRR